MSRGRKEGVRFFLVFALATAAAAADDARVTVQCPDLSAEDSAQVEARLLADLLSGGLTPSLVELSCDGAAAQTQVTGNGHQVTMRSDRGASTIKETLLASAESALAAWGAANKAASPQGAPLPPPASASTTSTSTTSTPAAAPAAARSPASEPVSPPIALVATPTRLPDPRPVDAAKITSTWLSAGPRAELWSDGWGLGAQLGLEQRLNSAFLAVHASYLSSLPPSSHFSAHALEFGADLGFQPRAALGLRGALGVGLSLFSASPAAGVQAQSSSTSSTLPFLNLELCRPIEFDALALLPALGAHAFSRSRSVYVDGQEVLALPAIALAASLSLALKVGG